MDDDIRAATGAARDDGAATLDATVSVRPNPKRPRRWLLIAALVVVSAVTVAAVSGLLRARDAGSPQYSLRQMASAVENKDWSGVERYVDVDAVASHFVGSMFAGQAAEGTSAAGAMRPGLAPKMTATFTRQFRAAVQQAVEATAATANRGVAGRPFVLRAKSVTYLGQNEALVLVELPVAGGGAQDVKLRMKRVDDHWRVIAVEDVADLMGLVN